MAQPRTHGLLQPNTAPFPTERDLRAMNHVQMRAIIASLYATAEFVQEGLLHAATQELARIDAILTSLPFQEAPRG